jgi:hypothetical protein
MLIDRLVPKIALHQQSDLGVQFLDLGLRWTACGLITTVKQAGRRPSLARFHAPIIV